MHFKRLNLKAVVFDYDETLSKPYGILDERVARKLKKLITSLRLTPFIVSGRPLDFLLERARKIGCSKIAAENGNIIHSNKKTITLKDGKDITTLFDPQIYEVKQTIVEFPEKMLPEALEILEKSRADYSLEKNNGRIMVMPAGTSKNKGLSKLLEMNDINFSEVMAFGDGENDINFMKESRVSIAVANAKPQVKDAADYTTKMPYGDGVLEFLERCDK